MKNIVFLFILMMSTSSCVSHRELVSFGEAEFPLDQAEEILNAINIRIQSEDLLRITVHSFDPAAAAPFNLEKEGQNQRQGAQGGNQGATSLELFMGYFVDQEGYIDFPVLGRISIQGKTLEEAKFEILERLKPYLKDAVVNIRYLNFKVTVLGEVNNPGTIRLTNKRVTLLEVLGMAGDLTDYANRKKILVIREENGKRAYEELNLETNEMFASPYFYLQQNDVLYIEPIKAKVATVADPAQRIISYGTGVFSLVALIISLTR